MWSQNNCLILEMLIFQRYGQKTIFKSNLKQRPFSQNVDIFGQNLFLQSDLKRNTFPWILIFSAIWANIFLEMLIFQRYGQKTIFKRDLKRSSFSLNFDIFGDMGPKGFFQSDLQMNSFSSKYQHFRMKIRQIKRKEPFFVSHF